MQPSSSPIAPVFAHALFRRRGIIAVTIAALVALAIAQDVLRPTLVHNVNHGTLTMDGPFQVIQQVIELAPGAASPVHSHGGPEGTLVLEGEVTLVFEADGAETVYAAGESYLVPADTWMMVRNDGDMNARFVVTFFLPEGATLTTPR